MNFQELVNTLVEMDIEYIFHHAGGAELLRHILTEGFDGYNACTFNELNDELKARGENK
jgi:hypothetical protein